MSFTSGTNGGKYTHRLSIDEMPSHFHATAKGQKDNDDPNIDDPYTTYQPETSIETGSYYTAKTLKAGGDKAHTNIQPYLVVYIFKRTT